MWLRSNPRECRPFRKKVRNSVRGFTDRRRKHRNLRSGLLFKMLSLRLGGYYDHYAFKGDSLEVGEFHDKATPILLKWLNRRSERRSLNWQGLNELMDHLSVARPRITRRLTKKTLVSVMPSDLCGGEFY